MIEKIKNNLFLVATIFGVFAVCTIFLPAISFDVKEVIGKYAEGLMVGISGVDACFGLELAGEEVLEFSFMGLLAYIAPVAGVAFLFYAEKNQEKKFVQYAFLAFAVGAILFFLMPSLLQYADKTSAEEVEEFIKLGVGAIFGAVACAVSALCVLGELQNNPKAQQIAQETQQNTQEA